MQNIYLVIHISILLYGIARTYRSISEADLYNTLLSLLIIGFALLFIMANIVMR